jgi:putative ABC transport system permease protein
MEHEDFVAFRAETRSFEAWALYPRGYVETILDSSSEPRQVQDMLVTPELFAMLGVDAALGRVLLPSDADPSSPNAAVISHELWQTAFGGDADVLGRTLAMRSGTYSIVGVAPPRADVPANWMSYPIVWRPVRTGSTPEMGFTALARLRSGVSIDSGRAELVALAAGLAAAQPDTHEGRTATVTLLRDTLVANVKRLLWIFFGAVACVLLIGVANLTMLQLARNAAREREVAVRAALGAGRARIVRERVVESLLLCGFGGVLGFAVAWLVVRLVVAVLPAYFPLAAEIGVDTAVAVFACGVAILVGVVMGVLPAWHASDPRLTRWLSESGRAATVGGRRSRTQRALVTVQTAVALVLLIGAGLLTNSLYRLISRDAGMREEGLSVATATLPLRYDETAEKAFWASALEQVRAIPGVQSAALASGTPLSGNDAVTFVAPEGVVVQSPRDALQISYRDVSDEYFSTLGIPLSRGRGILASDVAGAESVAVINELAAAKLWPGEDALGKRLGEPGGELKTVVGVVPTFRHTRLDRDLAPQIYVSRLQGPSFVRGAVMLYRAEPGDRRAAAAIRSTLTSLENDLELTVSSMADVRWRLVQPERFRTSVLLAFAGAAVLLALVGIIGVVAYTVGQRHREIAVRVALGAVPRDILRLTSRQAIVPALWGLALGLGGAFLATRLLSSYLVDIRALDVPTFAAAVVALALFVTGAAVMTARRALVVDPVEALRAE